MRRPTFQRARPGEPGRARPSVSPRASGGALAARPSRGGLRGDLAGRHGALGGRRGGAVRGLRAARLAPASRRGLRRRGLRRGGLRRGAASRAGFGGRLRPRASARRLRGRGLRGRRLRRRGLRRRRLRRRRLRRRGLRARASAAAGFGAAGFAAAGFGFGFAGGWLRRRGLRGAPASAPRPAWTSRRRLRRGGLRRRGVLRRGLGSVASRRAAWPSPSRRPAASAVPVGTAPSVGGRGGGVGGGRRLRRAGRPWRSRRGPTASPSRGLGLRLARAVADFGAAGAPGFGAPTASGRGLGLGGRRDGGVVLVARRSPAGRRSAALRPRSAAVSISFFGSDGIRATVCPAPCRRYAASASAASPQASASASVADRRSTRARRPASAARRARAATDGHRRSAARAHPRRGPGPAPTQRPPRPAHAAGGPRRGSWACVKRGIRRGPPAGHKSLHPVDRPYPESVPWGAHPKAPKTLPKGRRDAAPRSLPWSASR